MPTNAITKQLHLYFGVDGTLLDKSGDVFVNPQDDEIFEINAYIEDGVVNNQTTLINFTPNDRMAYTSHWFTMFYRELVEYIVPNESEPKTFAKFTIKVPSIVLLIKGGKVQFEQRITIVQRYGNTHLGNFETVTDLNVAYPPSETLDDNNDVAFVYSNESGETTQVGFYQVEYDGSNYAWVKKETLLYNLQTKQYNVLGFTVNVGMANPSGVPTISESVIYQLMQEISHVYIDINALEVQVVENKDTIENMLDGTTIVKKAEQDKNGNDIVTTYETKNDATSKLALKADKTYVDSQDQALDDKIVLLETANMIKSVSRTGTNLITLTFYNNDTSNIVTLSELKAFIGNASTTLDGLMSAQDKTDLNTLMALFDSDPDSVVNTIAEILEIFQNYPEGADLVTVLAGKEDKANKATNFTVVNDEKYPSVKAVKDFVDSSVRNSLKIVDTETSEAYKLKLYVTNGQLGYEIEEE